MDIVVVEDIAAAADVVVVEDIAAVAAVHVAPAARHFPT